MAARRPSILQPRAHRFPSRGPRDQFLLSSKDRGPARPRAASQSGKTSLALHPRSLAATPISFPPSHFPAEARSLVLSPWQGPASPSPPALSFLPELSLPSLSAPGLFSFRPSARFLLRRR